MSVNNILVVNFIVAMFDRQGIPPRVVTEMFGQELCADEVGMSLSFANKHYTSLIDVYFDKRETWIHYAMTDDNRMTRCKSVLFDSKFSIRGMIRDIESHLK